MEPYGLPAGTSIYYKALGFPRWVDALCEQWGLDSSTYPGHQEGDRPDIGCAPNPDHQNRGVDWVGPPDRMLDFARWLISIGPDRIPGQYGPPGLEMVIYEHAPTGERVWYPPWVSYDADFGGHRDHVHTRQSAALIDVAPLSRKDQYAVAIIQEGQRRGVSPRGVKIALATALTESNLSNYANSNVPESLNIPHDAVGSDHDSVGLFQQRCPMWGPAGVLMNPTASAGLFYDHLVALDYNNEANTPGFYAQAVQRSAFPDRYDQRYGEASALYDRLAGAPAQPEEEDWMADPELERMIREVHAALYSRRPSKSRYGDPNIAWEPRDFWWNDDGFLYDLICEHDAALGDATALGRVRQAAANGDLVAARFLERLSAPPTTAPPQTTPPTPPPTQPNPPAQPITAPAPVIASPSLASAADNFAQQMAAVRESLHKLIG